MNPSGVAAPIDAVTATGEALRLESVSKAYPGVRALADISFAVGNGEIHALLGENGAGKSTLIRILSGVERPDAGTIWLDGGPFHPDSPQAALRAGVSTLYQEQNLLPDRSVLHNILLGDEPRRLRVLLDRRAMKEAARSALEVVDAGHIPLHVPVGSLNVADRQLVDISRALRRHSRLLIMDEPTAALSAREVDALFSVVESLPGRGVTVIFVTHRMEEIFRIADSVTVLRDGAHVRTEPITAAVSADSLIDDMVGEHANTVLDARPRQEETADPVLTVSALSGPGFDRVDLQVRAGEILAITGVTGSGKEHLAMTLCGAVPATSGRVDVAGRRLRLNPRAARRAGVVGVPADRARDGVIGALSVQRNLALPSLPELSRFGILSRRRERQLASRQQQDLSIRTRRLDTPVGQLSGGNQQKVSLGKWLHEQPRVLILVEPTQGIDVKVRFEFYRLLYRLAEHQSAVVVVSSDIAEVLSLADRILVMRSGRVAGAMKREDATAEAVVRLSMGAAQDGTAEQRSSSTVDKAAPGPWA